MSYDEKWLAGGFILNDHEIESSAADEIKPSDYTDMRPLGNWIVEIPDLAPIGSELEKSGI